MIEIYLINYLKTMIFLTFEELVLISQIIELVIAIFLLIGYSFLIIVGTLHLRIPEKSIDSKLFILVGSIGISYYILSQILTYIFFDLSIYFQGLIPNIIFLITFGIIFIILGHRNKENFGDNLIYSGICSITYFSMLVINHIIILNMLSNHTYSPGDNIYDTIRLTIKLIALIPLVLSRIFYITYAYKINDRYFKYSAMSLLIASLITVLTEIIYLLA